MAQDTASLVAAPDSATVAIGVKHTVVPLEYRQFKDESELPIVMKLIDEELSEPYSIFTYRYFIRQWPQLCYMAFAEGKPVGTIVCKIDEHKSGTFRGYIAMLVVVKSMRGRGVATDLVSQCLKVMQEGGCSEVALEAEVTNKGALALYGNLGFIRAKRLHRYYLNGVDAFRLKLRFPQASAESADDAQGLGSESSDVKPSLGHGGLISHGHDRGHHVHGPNCSHAHHHPPPQPQPTHHHVHSAACQHHHH